jgi:hypothetical protein
VQNCVQGPSSSQQCVCSPSDGSEPQTAAPPFHPHMHNIPCQATATAPIHLPGILTGLRTDQAGATYTIDECRLTSLIRQEQIATRHRQAESCDASPHMAPSPHRQQQMKYDLHLDK